MKKTRILLTLVVAILISVMSSASVFAGGKQKFIGGEDEYFKWGHWWHQPTCADIESLKMHGITIVSAMEVEENELPKHCAVLGVIGEEINFELLLPERTDWNGKFLMGGGGGFVGTIQNHAMLSFLSLGGNALERGYATSGTDTGHSAEEPGASWAYNNLKRKLNFGYRAIHLTAVVSKAIIRFYYRSPIKYSYFAGCSRGGGQGMMEAQRFPRDFDGIISGAPAFSWTGFAMAMAWGQQLMYPDPDDLSTPVLPIDKLDMIETALLDNCDAIDGLEDGLIDDPRNCTFDPTTDLEICPEGEDNADCFTLAQLVVIQRIYDGPSNSRGQIFPGWPYGGEAEAANWERWMVGEGGMFGEYPSRHYYYGNEILRYLVYNDPSYDLHDFNYETDVRDTRRAARILNATNPNLRRFKRHGGKMIMWHGWYDAALSALATIEYYEKVVKTMGGRENVEDFYRLFLAPGMMHCAGGPGPNIVDYVSYLEAWVEDGILPDEMIASGINPSTGLERTRPLCHYPKVARLLAPGLDPNSAENFECIEP